ncbi:Rne/Rng family ribonuclease [Aminobacter aganoensis]|uniref:Ribonuclease E n=1 Tax=Aminobacter aganoensis TaxID=83264 RepID=A0A7X0CCP7_9HYPH|nr:ribonuclease E/G [Aminobacter aganoensis]MBB6352283.1 ribonuclease E [Aminobacter aganoensis]
MPNKMLIDASHPEETRVVVVRGNRIEEFDFESQDKKQLKGNIYLARVTRVEPSLQAAFVEYGGNRHGFLAFSEIHPDYYQIPVADRQALLRAEAEEAEDEEDDDDNGEDRQDRNRGRRRRRGGKNRGRNGDEQKPDGASDDEGSHSEDDGEPMAAASDDEGDSTAAGESETNGDAPETAADDETTSDEREPTSIAASVDADVVSELPEPTVTENENGGVIEEVHSAHHDDHEIESVGAEDALEEVRNRRKPVRRHYKIQEVIKRRQILLVQVVKEERGNKGAALTTYLSLAGRYSVLMPNTARGGGISRKITNAQDRKRLKEVVADLEVPKGMGVILRTAGESRTKAEIKRDYEYLMRLWENVRSLTLQSTAPALVYEEGSLIKRSVRDLYNKDIDEVLVAGEDGYREAKDFMRMLMPSHAKVVQPYRDITPIFVRSGIESQLERMVQPQVTLKSGGYIIINQTEALVAIDVNSGRSTKEHSIEETALHTNLEAAEEVARQLRLRDLAGLIVIDFIDMEENRNNRAVEKKLKDCLKNDRARIQVGRISHFGLMEMSRQRIRASVLESTMKPCPHCGGTGHVRSDSSVALQVVRAIEEFLLKDSRSHITVKTPAATALYVLNHKRSTLVDLEARFGVTITLEADDNVGSQNHAIFRGAIAEKPASFSLPVIAPAYEEPEEVEDEIVVEEEEEATVSAEAQPARAPQPSGEGEQHDRKRRKRRRRRGGRDREHGASQDAAAVASEAVGSEDEETDSDAEIETTADVAAPEAANADAANDEAAAKKRRRGKRGGKRNRKEDDELSAAEGDEQTASEDAVAEPGVSDAEAVEAAAVEAVAAEPEAVVEAKPKRAPRRSAKAKKADAEAAEAPAAEAVAEAVVAEEVIVDAAVSEPAAKPAKKPAKPRAPRRKAAAAPAEQEVVASPAEQEVAAALAEPEAVAAPAAQEAVAKAPAARAAKAPAAPVVTSAVDADDEASNEAKPKKGGWWQRKGFF